MSTVGPMRIYVLVSSVVEVNLSRLLDMQVMDGRASSTSGAVDCCRLCEGHKWMR
jgi:hypothetical protein